MSWFKKLFGYELGYNEEAKDHMAGIAKEAEKLRQSMLNDFQAQTHKNLESYSRFCGLMRDFFDSESKK